MKYNKQQYIRIAELIANELNDSISESDKVYLNEWINKSSENQDIYNTIKEEGWYASTSKEDQDLNIALAWEKLSPRIRSKSKIKFLSPNIYKYVAAASILLIVALSILLKKETINSFEKPVIVNSNIEAGTNKATLTLEDGSVIALVKGEFYESNIVTSNGEELIYKTASKGKKTGYNYLTVPRGGQFFVKFSDGTQVWLNSETQLKYPISFKEKETRQVELVYGEAYFDVSPSTDHKGAKFKVINNAQEVQVLGTEFNVKAYKDETNVYTTLVEGKVEINTSIAKQTLVPNQQSNVDVINYNISVKIVDVDSETSWKNGIFSFKGKSLKEIMKVISRWYDVDVIFENKDLELIKFKGTLSKNQKLEDILSIMKSTSINNYEIIDKTIILK